MVLDIPNHKEIFGQGDTRETSITHVNQENFNANDFDVISDVVNLKNKTSYWSCNGVKFKVRTNGLNYQYHLTGGYISISSTATAVFTQVNLPNGAVITGAVVYGSEADETWTLYRTALNTAEAGTLLATGNIQSEDTSISNATVDNATYGYFFVTSGLDATDLITGARITYTTDYI